MITLTALLLACSPQSDDTATTADSGGDTAVDTCQATARGTLPADTVQLSWDDGDSRGSLRTEDWAIGDYVLGESKSHEWVRFEPAVDTTIHGVSAQVVGLPDNPDALVTLALYDDFGFNGFDAWWPEPLWEGSLCAKDLVEGEWATWVLDEPITVPAGSLVYAGHPRFGADDVAILFDDASQGDGSCATWDDCHSAVNLPDATSITLSGVTYTFWKGYSGSLPRDYLLRLDVTQDDAPAADDLVFSLDADKPFGSRQAWGDYDNDGFEDLYLPGALWHNDGDGGFTDATDSSGMAAMGIASSGGVWGDYDNDGCLDLFVFAESYSAGDSLLHNDCGGGFTDVTLTAGIDDVQDYNLDCDGEHAPSPAAAWWDVDADGLLDLYVSNFICWDAYSYYVDQLWHNEGDGSFSEWTEGHGLTSSKMASRGANPIDADQDGNVDLFVHNYVLQRNLFYDNLGDGTVDEQALAAGLGGEATSVGLASYYGHTIGSAWGDLDGDGDFDLIAANLAHPRYFDFSNKTQVLINDGTGLFTDNAGSWERPYSDNGLRYQETHSVPTLGDFDSDGVLDLAITAVYDGRPTDFYWGVGDGSFTPAWAGSGITTTNGWGMSAGDVDNDGDLDLVTSGGFFVNQHPQGHWLQVRVLGDVDSNRAGIGAIVKLTDGDGTVHVSTVQGGTGQGEQDSMVLHFGLGDVATVTSVSVSFVGGRSITQEGPWDADQRLWISESGRVATGVGVPEWW